MMKKILSVLVLIAVLAGSTALAASMGTYRSYANTVAGWSDAEWTDYGSRNLRFLDVDEGVSIAACLNGNYVAALTIESTRNGSLLTYAKPALESLGVLSTGTVRRLSSLEHGVPYSADGYTLMYVQGEQRECIYIASDADFPYLVFVSTRGGTKYHINATCSGMDTATAVTVDVAEELGFTPCGRENWDNYGQIAA